MPCKVRLKASVWEIRTFDKLSQYCVEFVCDDIIYCKLCLKAGEIVENILGTNIPFTLVKVARVINLKLFFMN